MGAGQAKARSDPHRAQVQSPDAAEAQRWQCLPAGHPGPDSDHPAPDWSERHVIRVWYPALFFKQTLKRRVSFSSCVEALAPPRTPIPGPETHPREGFPKLHSLQLRWPPALQ